MWLRVNAAVAELDRRRWTSDEAPPISPSDQLSNGSQSQHSISDMGQSCLP